MPAASSAAAPRLRLDALLAGLARPLVALSGGADSALLAARVAAACPGAAAATLTGPLFPDAEIAAARDLAERLGLPHTCVPLDALAVEAIRTNPPDRCYHCKRAGFGALARLAAERGHGALLDGQNADDAADHRPGARAAAELGVRSPLREAGLTKAQIRAWSRELGLPTADVPAAACLASRIPHGTALTAEALARVAEAEAWLRARGFARVRVRAHGDVARIELEPEDVPRLAARPLREEASAALSGLGFRYVAVDLGGYRMGSLNP